MKITIQKYDPSTDNAPYDIESEVEYKEGITALEAVTAIHENDQPINFDFSCHSRGCGRCAVQIDGSPSLLCVTPLDDGPHDIRPLPAYPIIRDLVVDKSEFYSVISTVNKRIRLEPISTENFKEGFDTAQPLDLLGIMQMCSRCGMCMSVCPVRQESPDEYVGPAVMLTIAQREFDYLDQSDRILQAVSSGLYKCINCGTCSSVCMAAIQHLEVWKILRDRAEERGLKPSYAD